MINWKFISVLIGTAATVLTIISSWMMLGLPITATRGYVQDVVKPIICRQYSIQKHVNSVDLFQWQQNPKPWSQGIQEEVDRLSSEISSLTVQLERNC